MMTNERKAVRSAMRLAKILIILTCCIAFGALEANAVPVISRTEVVGYLSRFGYLPAIDQESEAPTSEEAFSRAISKFQSFMGINITGEIDVETTNLMTKPRCGVPDIVRPELGNRSKRYALLEKKWDHRNLTYKVTKYSSKLNVTDVDDAIAKAFAVWSNYVDLTFTPESGQVDIEISFVRGSHGDAQPFDGPGKVLAHAYFPGPGIGGDIHFDDDESWVVDSNDGDDFLQVAVHEIGHTLGLHHSNVSSAIMYAERNNDLPIMMLDSDDIAKIQALYGAKTDHNTTKDNSEDEDPQLCAVTKIDTIFTTPDNRVYVFKGKYYWQLIDGGIAAGYPKLIAETWRGLPSDIDAACVLNNRIYFFKGSNYWAYSWMQLVTGYPKEIGQNIADIEAVLVTNEDYRNDDFKRIYLFKGSSYWTSDPSGSSQFSLFSVTSPISVWPSSPFIFSKIWKTDPTLGYQWSDILNNLDAALIYKGRVYFFKDDVYYQFDEKTLLIDERGPRKIASDWFGCRSEGDIEPSIDS